MREDRDEDGKCDLYNYTPREFTPNNLVQGTVNLPGDGYLKPSSATLLVDNDNAHYLSSRYKDNYDNFFNTYDDEELIVRYMGVPDRPGEHGYSWDYSFSTTGAKYGYEGCLRNLVDAWNYYGGSGAATIEVIPDGETTETTTKIFWFNANPEDFVPAEYFDQVENTPYTLPEAQALRQVTLYKAFVDNLQPETCKVDNCARFTRLCDGGVFAWECIDPLSRYILEADAVPSEVGDCSEWCGTKESLYCGTPNLHDEAGDGDTQARRTSIVCTDENGDYPPEEGVPAPGLDKWYRNEDQIDSNYDGIGDKCSMRPDVVEMIQRHDWQPLGWSLGGLRGTPLTGSIRGDWWSVDQFQTIIDSGNSFVAGADGDALDKVNGYKVRFGDINPPPTPSTPIDYMSMSELENVCDGCADCEIRAKVLKAQQKLSFKVSGFSMEPVDTTLGACSCAGPDTIDCWSGLQDCTHPIDRGWDTADPVALEAYEGLARDREYNSSNRPRYPGFRYAANRTADTVWATDQEERWQGEVLTPMCQNQTILQPLGGDFLGFKIVKPAWDERPGTHESPATEEPLVGCQEISVTYNIGDSRSLTWRHQGQQEPDSSTIPPEQFWFNGHKTRMRLATRVPGEETADFGVDGTRDVWLRQWHSDTEFSGFHSLELSSAEDSIWQEDHQRPLSDAQLGGKDGVVLIERRCDGSFLFTPGWWAEVGVDDWWVSGISGLSRRPESFTREEIVLGSDFVSGVERRFSRDGVSSRSWWSAAERPEGRFPVVGYTWMEIYVSTEVAAARFGLDNANNQYPEDEMFRVDIVLGGLLPDGTPSNAIWMRRSWNEVPTFETVTTASQVSFDRKPQVFVDSATGRILAINGAGPNSGVGVFELNSMTGEWTELRDSVGNGLSVSADSLVVRDVAGGRAFVMSDTRAGMTISQLSLSGRAVELRPVVWADSALVPSSRTGATVKYSNGAIWLFGGRGRDQGLLSDLWSFDLRTRKWIDRTPQDGPTAREKAAFATIGDGSLALFGGVDEYGLVSRESFWNLATDRASVEWGRSSEEGEMQLAVGQPAFEAEFNPDAPAVFSLQTKGLALGEERIVQVVFANPAGNLKLAALPFESSAPVRVGAAGPAGSMSVALHGGETWRFAVVPKAEVPSADSDRTYSIEVRDAEQGSRIATISALPLTRFDTRNDAVVVANWSSVKVFERNGATMTRVGSASLPSAVDVVVDGNHAYVADFFHGLKVIDLSDPTTPQVVGSEWVVGLADAIAKIGDRIYLGTGLMGVQVVDVSDPAHPEWVETIPVEDVVVDVSSAGGMLMVSGLMDGVSLYNAAPGYDMTFLGRYEPRQCWVEDTAYYGGWMWVKGFGDIVELVDVRNAMDPKYMETIFGGRRGVTGRWGDSIVAVPGIWSGIAVNDVSRQ